MEVGPPPTRSPSFRHVSSNSATCRSPTPSVDALLKHGIPLQSVQHLLFTFSGNSPEVLLTSSSRAYPGPINQWGIGLQVDGHAAFIGAVYDRVIADANNV